ncbi:AbiJ-NTD4 domain-containing protein [Rhizobium ruizarguesonis]|uniref:AbiJ-NTD4 domain-containing protein n=1 Tax=Rhizobium ruizarguesonis TaxID=2081791 RepID=UPI001030525F|nr:hypothetical protein [Rhizobium ruizarguesonis]TBE66418.1 hypothetical protein ELH00_10695 [Rhizobium ruizarguesonis]
MSNEYRSSITFEQAMGIEPLPSQLKLDEVSPVLKARLWDAVHTQILKSAKYGNRGLLDDPMRRVAKRYMIERANILIDEWDNGTYELIEIWKKKFAPGATYADVLGFIEWFVRALRNPDVAKLIGNILTYERAAYRLEDWNIIPVASPEEGEAIVRAVSLATSSGMEGVRSHISKASTALTAGDYAGSVRESIHAVEAVAFKKTGQTGSFAGALKALNKAEPMHEAFRIALDKLYAYTSNEQGVRHSLFDQGDANVTERDALFMLGICSSFVTYLLQGNDAHPA